MRRERKTIDQVVFEEKDLSEMSINIRKRMGTFYVLTVGRDKYICTRQCISGSKFEYLVLGDYKR